MLPLRPPTVKTFEATEASKIKLVLAVNSGVNWIELRDKASEFFRSRLPAMTVVLPRKVFAPESESVPRPALVRPPPMVV